jgi:hypothetical protein
LSLRLPEIGIVLALSAAFSMGGDLLLARRSARLHEWAESFLVGCGVAANLLFALTLLTPRAALGLLAAILGIALLLGVALRWRTRGAQASSEGGSPASWVRDPVALSLFALSVFGAAAFAVLNWRYTYLWDGFQIWAARAQVLHHEGGLTPLFTPGDYLNKAFGYPSLVPMVEALVALLRGRFDFDALKPAFLPFFLAMMILTFHAARSLTTPRGGFTAAALLCLLPTVSTRWAAGGYAEIPQAAFVAAVAAAFAAPTGTGWRRPLPWLIGCLAAVKQEGLLLAIACLVAVAIAAARRRRWSGSWILPAVALMGLRLGYVRWAKAEDTTYGPFDSYAWSRAFSRIPEVAGLCLQQLVSFWEGGFFWIAFAAGAAWLLFSRAEPRLRILAAATTVGIVACSIPFLFTNWPVALQVGQAYQRLLAEIAPAAAVVMVAAYDQFRRSFSEETAPAGQELSGLATGLYRKPE